MRYFSIVSFLMFIFVAVPVDAATLTVGEDKQYQTIQSAVDAAEAGDLISIDDGEYTENITIPQNIHMKLTGNVDDPGAVVLNGNIMLEEKTASYNDWTQIRGMKIVATGKKYGVYAPVTVELGDVRIAHAQFGVMLTAGSLLIDDSVVRHSKKHGIVLKDDSVNIWMTDTVVKKNKKAGIRIVGDYYGRIMNSQLLKNGRGMTVKDGTFLYAENESYEGLHKSTIKNNRIGILLVNDSTLKRSENTFKRNRGRKVVKKTIE